MNKAYEKFQIPAPLLALILIPSLPKLRTPFSSNKISWVGDFKFDLKEVYLSRLEEKYEVV
jgi:hypothetical protein